MKKINLEQEWKVAGTDPAYTTSPPSSPLPPVAEWLPARVPGDVNADLLAARLIPDPHYDVQAKDAYWVTTKEWWYTTTFTGDSLGDTVDIDLCLDRVDGTADLWLNDTYLGCMKNTFHPYRFSIGNLVQTGENEIFIRFRCLEELLGGPRVDQVRGWNERRAYFRKPQYNFGWDWSLPLPSIGLGGEVWLEVEPQMGFADLTVQPFPTGRLDFSTVVTSAVKDTGYELYIRVEGLGFTGERRIEGKHHTANCTIDIPEPQLWYPNGWGDQPLYGYEVNLFIGGRVVDTRRGRIGLRKVEILERPYDQPDRQHASECYSFEFIVNGTPIFCKGSNWIPMEIWPATIDEHDYAYYLHRALEAGFNMVRVWGGGIYENDRFYDLCDELGIMVWQDFMFASAGFPAELLRDEIAIEATYQLKRLRNHPAIMLWCGCNEDVFSWRHQMHNTDANDESSAEGQGDDSAFGTAEKHWKVDRLRDDPQIYTMLLRGLADKLGFGVPYIESSPQSRDDSGNTPSSGNCHISCWKYALFETEGHPERFRDHFEAMCSFDSEFCIQGPAREKTIRRFMAPGNHWPPTDAWTYHIQRGHANLPHHEQTMMIAGAIYGEIDSLETYVKYGQATHVEMTRAEYESARRDRPNNGGTMSWMFNDCWPTSNWSIIDYYRWPKPSFYAAKRACRPIVPIIFERNGTISAFVDNQSPRTVNCTLTFGQATIHGAETWSRERSFRLATNRTVTAFQIERSNLVTDATHYLFADLVVDGALIDGITWFPDGWHNIRWPDTQIDVSVDALRESGMYEVLIQATRYTRLCHLIWEGATSDTVFSDNYFDLRPGRERRITVRSSTPLDPKGLSIGHWLGRWE